MSIPINCFDQIIGITKSECECFGDIDRYDSLSGLYIDGLIELSDVFNLVNCQNGNDVSEVIKKSFEEAKKEFMADFNSNLLANFRNNRKPFFGVIGRSAYKSNIDTFHGNIAGVRVACADVVGGSLKIKKVGMIFNATSTVRVHVKDNLNTYYGFWDLPTQEAANKVSSVDLELPLHSPYTDNLEYFFYYQTSPYIKPKKNDIKCGSCGSFRPKFDMDRPYYNSQTGGQYGWANWVMAGGFSTPLPLDQDPEEKDFSCMDRRSSNMLYGITLYVDLGCDTNLILCNDSLDFTSPIPIATAHAIRYRAGAIILEKLIRSQMINRLTMVNRDEKKEAVVYWNEKYQSLLNYIITNLNFDDTDCLCEKPKFETGVRTIMS